MTDLTHMGFEINSLGKQTFALKGIPSDLELGNEKELIIELVESFKDNFKAFEEYANEDILAGGPLV